MNSKVYESLYQQNSMENIVCLSEIKTEQDKKDYYDNHYIIPYTCFEWEKLYPLIPAKFIYYTKSYLYPSEPLYIDIEHYIMFHIRLYGNNYLSLNGETLEDYINQILAMQKKAYEEKKYYDLIEPELSEANGNFALYLLNQMLEHEHPSSKLYATFINVYSFVDNGIGNLSDTAKNNLYLCKSDLQKKKTLESLSCYPEEIIIYRGEGSNSTSYQASISWTTNKSIAYLFATKNGAKKSRIITGKIKKENVLEFICDRKEDEIISKSEFVEIIDIHNFITLDDFFALLQHDASKNFQYDNLPIPNIHSLINQIEELYTKYAKTKNAGHTKGHTIRVMMHANYLYRKLVFSQYINADIKTKEQTVLYFSYLMDAAIYHDIGRTNADIDNNHGKVSYKIYKKDKGFNAIVKFLIEQHCIDDSISLASISQFSVQASDVLLLYNILKDADALDRVRFGRSLDGLNIDLLRLPESQDLVAVANALLEYKYD